MSRRIRISWISTALLGLVALVLIGWLVGGRDSSSATVTPTPTGGAVATFSGSGLPVRSLSELPPEAAQVWRSIGTGGPFRFQRDGAPFGNREGLLPPREPGCYREYTVPTPGEDDRGARRLVTGCGGELYYTADHYASFVQVDPYR